MDPAMTNIHVQSEPLPKDSALRRLIGDGDFVDCYGADAIITPRAAARIITDWPIWARALLGLRRAITAPFGLSNDGPDAADKVGPFPVESETPTELIAGFDDAHLNFRISVMTKGDRVRLATWVHPHNLAGRAYLALIMPFHILIARNAIARVRAAQSAAPTPE